MYSKELKLPDGSSCDYAAIFMQCHNSLVLYAEKYIGSREESLSIVQDAFLALWESKRIFDNEDDLQKYLYTTTRNKALNHLRKINAATNYTKTLTAEEAEYRDRLLFIEEETFKLLLCEIHNLPERQREVVLLALDDKNNTEIADLLNISVNTVKFHKKNAYVVLREKMADSYFLLFLLF